MVGLILATLFAAATQTVPAPVDAEPILVEEVTAKAGLPVTYIRPTIDHVVTYNFTPYFSSKAGARLTYARRGHLVRQTTEYLTTRRPIDPPGQTNYSNLATNASAQGELRGPNEPSGFVIWREHEGKRPGDRYRLIKTEETQTIAGEHCAIWNAEPIVEKKGSRTGIQRRACIANDGVVLYDAWLYSSGGVGEERTAVKVERRKVALAEVLPPKDALNGRAWMALAASARPVETTRPRNFDVNLLRQPYWDKKTVRARRRGSDGWELSETWSNGEAQTFYLYHSSMALRFGITPERVDIDYTPDPKFSSWGSGTVPVTRMPPETVLGEQCSWFDAAVNVSDTTQLECRAADGLPLKTVSSSWGDNESTLIATSVSRGKTRLRDLLPPPALLRWQDWGWPELAKAAQK